MKKILFYLPRIITIIFVIFMTAIAIQGTRTGCNLTGILSSFGLAAITLILMIIAWIRPKIGGGILSILGIILIITMIYGPSRGTPIEWLAVIIIGGPILLSGILFSVEGFRKK